MWSGSGPLDAVAQVVGLELRAWRARVKHLADLGSLIEQLRATGLDVGNDQVEAVRRSWRRPGDLVAELDGTQRSGWRELDDPVPVVVREVRIEPPSESSVEILRAIGVRNRNHHDFELQVHGSFAALLGAAVLQIARAHPNLLLVAVV